MHIFVHCMCVIVIATLSFGCFSTSTGTRMERASIEQIERGVSTRADVERLFGAPTHVAIMPEGGRIMMYSNYEQRMKGESFIPVAGIFMGGAKGRSQSLQIILNKDNIVEDYEFLDKEHEIDNVAFGGMRRTEREVKK